ncbi:hypothetical protein HSX11_18840 [Oxalobacteraceae bacterium]|nr:hypothetical protein [Oxalobacteraceae bacterium]
MKAKHFTALACLIFAAMFYATASRELSFIISGTRYDFFTTKELSNGFVLLAVVFELFALKQWIKRYIE